MRMLLSLLSLVAIASAQYEYVDDMSDFDTNASPSWRADAVRRGDSEYHKELPLGQEMALGLKQLSKFHKSRITADRIGRYEVNPDFDFDGARSLNLKMTPILNFQKSNLVSGVPLSTRTRVGDAIMLKLSSMGIKPITVKTFLKLKKQGVVDMSSPIKTMFEIQRELETDPTLISSSYSLSPSLSSSSLYDVNTLQQPWTIADNVSPYTSSSSSSFVSSPVSSSSLGSVDVGVVIPSINLATQLQTLGFGVSTTMAAEPAIEINYLKNCLLKCETVQFKPIQCAKLNELTVLLLGPSSSSSSSLLSSSEIVHDTIVDLQNKIQLKKLQTFDNEIMDMDKLF